MNMPGSRRRTVTRAHQEAARTDRLEASLPPLPQAVEPPKPAARRKRGPKKKTS